MVTTAADDPVRAEVERWLHAVVGATIATPAAIVGGAGRCVTRRAGAVRDRLVQPARLVKSLLDLAGRAAPAATDVGGVDPRDGGEPRPAVLTAPVDVPSVDAAALPIDEYESLAASQVVARLPSLTAGELGAVRRFEADHRGRRTVLGRIDQLLAPA